MKMIITGQDITELSFICGYLEGITNLPSDKISSDIQMRLEEARKQLMGLRSRMLQAYT